MIVYILLFIQSLIGSGTHIVAKVVVTEMDASTVTLFRSVLAAIGFLILVLSRVLNFKFEKKDYKHIVLLGILAVVFNQFLFLYAMKFTTPSNAALLYATTPTLVLFLANYFYGEKITIKKSVGLLLAFIGILIIIFEKGINIETNITKGNLLMIVAVLSWALYTVLGKNMILKYGSLKTSSTALIIGAIIFLPICIIDSVNFRLDTFTSDQFVGILYLGLGTSIIAYSIWYYALRKSQAAKVAIFSNLQPVITTLLSVLILKMPISFVFIVGGIVVISGVIITQFSK